LNPHPNTLKRSSRSFGSLGLLPLALATALSLTGGAQSANTPPANTPPPGLIRPPSAPLDLPPGALRLSQNSVALTDERGHYSLLSAPEGSLIIYNASGWWIKTRGVLTLLQASTPRPQTVSTAPQTQSSSLQVAAALVKEKPSARLQIVLVAVKTVTLTDISYGETQWLTAPLTLRAGTRLELSHTGPSSGTV